MRPATAAGPTAPRGGGKETTGVRDGLAALRGGAALGLLLAAGACQAAFGGLHALRAGEAQFKAGEYPAAKVIFASVEAGARRWPAPRQAEYALYRGLTLDALGDEDGARAWLGRARSLEASRPGSLSASDVLRLSDVAHVLSDEAR